MFYSHQLLARKAPLGQIWMAATMHAKINRRKLDQLDLVKICEEILNPSVPMALRLSGILMGGVVIVYERKVKLLYDDVTRLVVEINEAWKAKPAADPTILPKSKHKAKFEAVTMEQRPLEEEMMTLGAEQTSFPHQNFLHMGLDSVGDMFININPGDDDNDQQHHQADKENITLDDINMGLQETSLFSRAERFDHVMEEGGHITFSQLSPEVPTTLMPSPPEPPQAGTHREQEKKLQSTPLDECKNNEMEQTRQNGHMRQPKRQKAEGRSNRVIMDEEQTIISGQMYQAWIRDASDIVSRRGRDRKRLRPFSMAKISYLIELPPVALISGFQNDINGEIHYPGSLLGLWKKFDEQERQSKHDPNRGNIFAAQEQQPPLPPTTTGREQSGAAGDFLFENFENGPDQMEMSIEGIREHPLGFDFSAPGSSGHSVAGSVGTASSGRDSFQMEREFLSSDKLKKRPQNFGNLDPVFEDGPMYEYRTDFKLRRVAAIEPTPEFDLMEETGPTPTLKPSRTEVAGNEMTRSIQTHFKTHFDEPGAPPNESLNQLACGMNRRKAALLFYHTCVLATTDHLRVEQKEPYGEILISRGSKM